MKVLIIDNFDSYTWNLYQYVGAVPGVREVSVVRNDRVTSDGVRAAGYDRVIVSPGPGDPSDSAYFGACGEVLTGLGRDTPVLGVCLGMQGMAHYFGGRVGRAAVPMHGKTSEITHDGLGVFRGLPQRLTVMRYHSLAAVEDALPGCLVVTSRVAGGDGRGEIMGLRHRDLPVEGVQFHPESFATEGGPEMIANFLLGTGTLVRVRP